MQFGFDGFSSNSRTENPCVGGSTPSLFRKKTQAMSLGFLFTLTFCDAENYIIPGNCAEKPLEAYGGSGC